MSSLSTIFGLICHELYVVRMALRLVLASCLAFNLAAQVFTPALPPPPPQANPVSPDPNKKVLPLRPDAPKDPKEYMVEDTCIVQAQTETTATPTCEQERDGNWRHLRGNVRIESADMQIKADELDWNTETDYVEARGHVHFEYFARGEKLDCDKVQ
jgi:hypothetical protein